MANSTASFSVQLDWDSSWPLYTVYPASALLFLALYRVGPWFWPKVFDRYLKWTSNLSRWSWQQNVNALLHTVVLCPLLLVAIVTDPVMLIERPLHQHHNTIGYVALCWSLGYFTFTIPWSLRLYCQGERQATNLALVVHHFIVFIAALSYLIFRTAALYGAVAFAAMECTNVFFVAHLLQQQARAKWQRLWTVNYVVGVVLIGVIGMRLGLCTYMFVLFSIDISTFSSDNAVEWVVVCVQYAIFLAVVILSWIFIWKGVKEAGLDKVALNILSFKKPKDGTATAKGGGEGKKKPGRAVNALNATAATIHDEPPLKPAI